jgi:hypothetical protein
MGRFRRPGCEDDGLCTVSGGSNRNAALPSRSSAVTTALRLKPKARRMAAGNVICPARGDDEFFLHVLLHEMQSVFPKKSGLEAGHSRDQGTCAITPQ